MCSLYYGYNCTASREPPVVTITPRQLTVAIGQSARLTCTASGMPAPSVEWSRLQGSLNQQATVVDGVLWIPAVTRADQDQYVCTARNHLGTHQQRAMITVTGGVWRTQHMLVRGMCKVKVACMLSWVSTNAYYDWSDT